MKCRNFQSVCSLLLHRNKALIGFNHKLFFAIKNWEFKTNFCSNWPGQEIWISKCPKLGKKCNLTKKITKTGLVDWFGIRNVTITISIHYQKSNGYPIQYWTGWTDQSKAGLVTHTLTGFTKRKFVIGKWLTRLFSFEISTSLVWNLRTLRNVILLWNTLYLKTWKHFRGKVVSKRPWIFGLHMKAKQKKRSHVKEFSCKC